MRIVIIIISVPFLLRMIIYIYHLIIVKKFLLEPPKHNDISAEKQVLVLIPVLREQAVIQNTIKHFTQMNLEGIKLYLVVVGTTREKKHDKETTLEVVEEWMSKYINDLPKNISIDYCKAEDVGGDRATQLNYAVDYIKATKKIAELDFIGVYDADSLPSEDSLQEALYTFVHDPMVGACQQPVHFILAANKMASGKENPILVANAIYQTTWTIISELPMWIKYAKRYSEKLSFRHLYLIGHGEFISEKIYDKFHFPEYEITDGIQLGYRLGMSNIKVMPLHEFCNDDVPHKLSALVKQHKRWFGGCMNFIPALRWAMDNFNNNPILQLLDGIYSQIRWAWTAAIYLFLLFISFMSYRLFFWLLMIIGIVYCYLFPIIAHKMINEAIRVRLIDWIFLPIAILIKSIGPNLYIVNKLFRKTIKYEKVER